MDKDYTIDLLTEEDLKSLDIRKVKWIKSFLCTYISGFSRIKDKAILEQKEKVCRQNKQLVDNYIQRFKNEKRKLKEKKN